MGPAPRFSKRFPLIFPLSVVGEHRGDNSPRSVTPLFSPFSFPLQGVVWKMMALVGVLGSFYLGFWPVPASIHALSRFIDNVFIWR